MHQPDHGKDPAWVWPYTSRESRLWTSSQCRYLARSWLIISWGELIERKKYQWKEARILVTYRPTLLSTQWGFLNIEMLLQESESGAVLFIHFSPENFISHYLFTLEAEQNFREKLVFLLPSFLPDEHTWVTNITAWDDVVCFTVRENRLVVQITQGGSMGSPCDALPDTKSDSEHMGSIHSPLGNVYKVK